MALRGHRESLLDPNINTGNFLEALKYLADYDTTIRRHLEKVRQKQELLASKDGGAKGAKGRGSKLTFHETYDHRSVAVLTVTGHFIYSHV